MKLLLVFILLIVQLHLRAQNNKEYINIDCPAEYNWKVVDRKTESNFKSIVIIPGNETVNNPSIIGTIAARMGAHFNNLTDIVKLYKDYLDTGTKFSIVDSSDTASHLWVIFKVETPKNEKYPEPESDMYYVTQGQAALYQNYVAIKEPFISPKFESKWLKVFKTAKLSIIK
jgi:hypothetical protein